MEKGFAAMNGTCNKVKCFYIHIGISVSRFYEKFMRTKEEKHSQLYTFYIFKICTFVEICQFEKLLVSPLVCLFIIFVSF